MDSKLNITNMKQLPISASKAAVPKKKILAKRKRTLDVEKPPGLSRSCSFDSSLSRLHVVDAEDDPSLPPYDPIENYLSPRPKYLRFNPDRHSKILARQENVSRMIKSASFGCGVPFLEEVSSDDNCSVEETEDIVKKSVVSTQDENEGEKEEFEDSNGWSRNVLLQYLIVVILLILTTMTICSMNSPTASHSNVGYKGFDLMMLMDGNLSQNMICYDNEKWDAKDLELRSYELAKMQHGHTTKVTEIDVDINKDETDEILGADLGQSNVNKDDTDVIRNPRSVIKEETKSRRTDPKKESYFQTLGADSGQNDVNEESVILKPIVEEDDSTNNGLDENEIEGIEDTDTLLTKLANLNPTFVAFSGAVIVLAFSSVLYKLIQRETSAHKNEVSDESGSSVGSFDTKSSIYSEFKKSKFPQSHRKNNASLSHSDASFSIRTKLSDSEMSIGDSYSQGSFTVEKMIIKKQVISICPSNV
ncbi:hypothetical protein CTI12_AA619560 [Artemisia annua]|uniref:Transmembrane protein n=1 Tax=Artemisia annua TaxID=35608 RepID=A0A2U1KCC5_ARTAN|nr:hypothetical protein CTI12_AA619560 [Artemisia annua]